MPREFFGWLPNNSATDTSRARLDEARAALGLSAANYTDPTLIAGYQIKAAHVQELRTKTNEALTTSAGTSLDLRWLVADHLGTPRMIFDQTGSLANMSRHDYLPFGEELFAGVGGRTTAQGYTASDNVRQKFTSKERDNETGLDYFLARYHASSQGRFTSTDPYFPMADADKEKLFRRYLQQPQNWNRYAYCINNPLAFVDPNGLGWYVKKGDSTGNPEWFDDDKVDTEKYEAVLFNVYRSVENDRKWYALNPFKNEMSEHNTAAEADAAYQGYILNQAIPDGPRLPDGITANGGFLTNGANLTLESHGNLFGGFDIYPRNPVNHNATSVSRFMRLGGSISFVWLNQGPAPSEQQATRFFSGPSISVGGGSHGVGGGITWSPGNSTGTNVGVYTPGPSISGGTANHFGKVPLFRWRF